MRATQLQKAFLPPNAGVKPPCGGAADMCERSVKHMADATTRGRLERLVRREGCRRGRLLGELAENRSLEAGARPTNFHPAVTEATASGAGKPAVRQSPLPKPARATHATCERAKRTLPKKQRAANFSEEQRRPEPMSRSCEPQNCKVLFLPPNA